MLQPLFGPWLPASRCNWVIFDQETFETNSFPTEPLLFFTPKKLKKLEKLEISFGKLSLELLAARKLSHMQSHWHHYLREIQQRHPRSDWFASFLLGSGDVANALQRRCSLLNRILEISGAWTPLRQPIFGPTRIFSPGRSHWGRWRWLNPMIAKPPKNQRSIHALERKQWFLAAQADRVIGLSSHFPYFHIRTYDSKKPCRHVQLRIDKTSGILVLGPFWS